MNKIESFELKKRSHRPEMLGALLGIVAGGALVWYVFFRAPEEKQPEPDRVRATYIIPLQYQSEDGRVSCYGLDTRTLSCIPTWMLDAPNSWIVTYKRKEKTK